MGVKAGPGGHDAGVLGVDEGSKTSTPLWKRERMVTSDDPTSSDFRRADNEDIGENQKGNDETASPDVGDEFPSASFVITERHRQTD